MTEQDFDRLAENIVGDLTPDLFEPARSALKIAYGQGKASALPATALAKAREELQRSLKQWLGSPQGQWAPGWLCEALEACEKAERESGKGEG